MLGTFFMADKKSIIYSFSISQISAFDGISHRNEKIELNLSVDFLHFLNNGLPIHAVFQDPDYRNRGILHNKED